MDCKPADPFDKRWDDYFDRQVAMHGNPNAEFLARAGLNPETGSQITHTGSSYQPIFSLSPSSSHSLATPQLISSSSISSYGSPDNVVRYLERAGYELRAVHRRLDVQDEMLGGIEKGVSRVERVLDDQGKSLTTINKNIHQFHKDTLRELGNINQNLGNIVDGLNLMHSSLSGGIQDIRQDVSKLDNNLNSMRLGLEDKFRDYELMVSSISKQLDNLRLTQAKAYFTEAKRQFIKLHNREQALVYIDKAINGWDAEPAFHIIKAGILFTDPNATIADKRLAFSCLDKAEANSFDRPEVYRDVLWCKVDIALSLGNYDDLQKVYETLDKQFTLCEWEKIRIVKFYAETGRKNPLEVIDNYCLKPDFPFFAKVFAEEQIRNIEGFFNLQLEISERWFLILKDNNLALQVPEFKFLTETREYILFEELQKHTPAIFDIEEVIERLKSYKETIENYYLRVVSDFNLIQDNYRCLSNVSVSYEKLLGIVLGVSTNDLEYHMSLFKNSEVFEKDAAERFELIFNYPEGDYKERYFKYINSLYEYEKNRIISRFHERILEEFKELYGSQISVRNPYDTMSKHELEQIYKSVETILKKIFNDSSPEKIYASYVDKFLIANTLKSVFGEELFIITENNSIFINEIYDMAVIYWNKKIYNMSNEFLNLLNRNATIKQLNNRAVFKLIVGVEYKPESFLNNKRDFLEQFGKNAKSYFTIFDNEIKKLLQDLRSCIKIRENCFESLRFFSIDELINRIDVQEGIKKARGCIIDFFRWVDDSKYRLQFDYIERTHAKRYGRYLEKLEILKSDLRRQEQIISNIRFFGPTVLTISHILLVPTALPIIPLALYFGTNIPGGFCVMLWIAAVSILNSFSNKTDRGEPEYTGSNDYDPKDDFKYIFSLFDKESKKRDLEHAIYLLKSDISCSSDPKEVKSILDSLISIIEQNRAEIDSKAKLIEEMCRKLQIEIAE